LGYRKGEGKGDKAYEGIHTGQAGEFDGAPFRTANALIFLALGQDAEACARSDLD